MTELNGLLLDLPEKTYHAHPALSATGVKYLLDSPAKFQYRITQGNTEHKAAFDLGSAVHAKVLGTGWGIVELDFPDYRTKAAREARDQAYAANEIPMLKKDLAQVYGMTEAVLAKRKARDIFEQDGNAEASVFGTDPNTGLAMRARFDWLAKVAADVKTTLDASPSGFRKSAADYRYHVQRAWYRDTYAAATGENPPEMLFIAVEKEPPYLVGVYQLDKDFREMGEVEAIYARHLYQQCTETGEWPGYSEDIELLAPPVWALREYQERFNE